MNTRAMLLGAAFAALIALPAQAQDAGAPPPAQNSSGAAPMRGGGMMGGGLGPIDTNHDGVISKDEWMAQFDKLDTNHDGKITADEMRAARQMRMSKMRAMGQQMQGQGGPGGAPGGAMMGGPSGGSPKGAPAQAPAAGDQPPPQDGADQ